MRASWISTSPLDSSHKCNFTATYDNETLERVKLDGYRNEPGAPSKLGEIVINGELFARLPVGPGQSDPFETSSDFQGKVSVDDSHNYHSTLTLDFEAMQVKFLNGYSEYSWFGQKDFDGTVSPASYVESIGQDEESTQHEVQFISNGDGDIDWVVGLFYYNNKASQPYTLSDANNPFLINNLSGAENPDGIFYTQFGEVDATSKAIYGQADWRVTERLSLSAGLRYSEDEKEGFESQQIFYDSVLDNCGESFLPDLIAGGDPYALQAGCVRFGLEVRNGEAEHKDDWDAVNWRINASYDIGEDSLLYATISTGYKPGGFRLGGLQDDPNTSNNESIVDNEELTAYEIGFKGTIADVLSISSAVFFYDYEDMQVELDILDPSSGIVTNKLVNASNVEVYGFEIESTWAATEKLTLLGNYSYVKSEFQDDFFVADIKQENAPVRNVKGNELNRTPNNKFTLAAYYVQPVGEADVVLTANYNYIDEQFVAVFNDDIEAIDSYEQLNGRIAWKPHNGNYEVSVYGINLTDKVSYGNDYSVGAFAAGSRRSARPINPRTYGLEVAIFF